MKNEKHKTTATAKRKSDHSTAEKNEAKKQKGAGGEGVNPGGDNSQLKAGIDDTGSTAFDYTAIPVNIGAGGSTSTAGIISNPYMSSSKHKGHKKKDKKGKKGANSDGKGKNGPSVPSQDPVRRRESGSHTFGGKK